MKKIKIGKRHVGEGEPCFIIAEAGVNHNGDVDLAKKLIDAAMDAGVDAIKFQAFYTEAVVRKRDHDQYNMLKKLELSEENFLVLFDYAEISGLTFLSSAFDKESARMLDKIGISALKVASGEITNFPLLRYIAKLEKPVILSTGMSTLGEIEQALDALRGEGNDEIILLHCVSNYPAKAENTNLKAIQTIMTAFHLPVGFSDHTRSINIPAASVALGAVIIEKHFTLDRTLPGPDHNASLEPQELREMVEAVRSVEAAMGDGIKQPTQSEERIKTIARRSITAKVDIPKGSVITLKMLDLKRPAVGLPPKYLDLIVGRKAKRDIKEDDFISFEVIY